MQNLTTEMLEFGILYAVRVSPRRRPLRRRRCALVFGIATGRGHRRARIFDHQYQGGTAWC